MCKLISSGLSVRGDTRYFNHLRCSLIPPDFKECCYGYSIFFSNFEKKVPPVNSEVMIDLKNIESPASFNPSQQFSSCNYIVNSIINVCLFKYNFFSVS